MFGNERVHDTMKIRNITLYASVMDRFSMLRLFFTLLWSILLMLNDGLGIHVAIVTRIA